MKFTKSSGGNTLMKRALALLFVLVMVCALVVPAYATESGSVEGETILPTPAAEETVAPTKEPAESPAVESDAPTEQPTQEPEQTVAPTEKPEGADTEVQDPESTDESNIEVAALNDNISLTSISGDTTIKVDGTTTLKGNSGSNHSWSSSDSSVATVVGNGSTATVTGVSGGSVTISHSYYVWHGFRYENYIEQIKVTVDGPQAQIYYLKTPTSDPASNDSSQWGPCLSNGATVNTDNATWVADKNITTNASSYITSWPDGSTGATWTLVRDDTTTGTYFTTVLDNIFDVYKSTIEKDTGITNLQKTEITKITLTPYKISKYNSTTPDKHIDCTISVTTSRVYTANFWQIKPDGSANVLIEGKNIVKGDAVPETKKTVTPASYDVGGILYELDKWYVEDANGGYSEASVKADFGTTGYTPTETQYADGTVNFYAVYKPVKATITVTKIVNGLDLTTAKTLPNNFITGSVNYTETATTSIVELGEWTQDATTNQISATKAVEVYVPYDTTKAFTFTEDTTKVALDDYNLISDAATKTVTLAKGTDGKYTASVTFTNTYEKKATSLTVSKTVTGKLGDMSKEFEFKVSYIDTTGASQTATLNLASGKSATVENIKVGSVITVTETDPNPASSTNKYYTTYSVNGATAVEGYTATITSAAADGNNTVVFVNNKDYNPDTGVSLDSLPYVIVLTLAIAGSAAFIIRRRKSSES
jgi:hypothetical protein